MQRRKLLKVTLIFLALIPLIMSSCNKNKSEFLPQDDAKGMIAIDNIMTRVSVRQYTGKEVPEDTLATLLKAAMAAPSAKNLQPWEIVVVKDVNKRAALAECLPNVGDKAKTAGAVVLICGNKNRFIEEAPEYWVQDCSAATENLLLAAHALGLGAVWCGVYPVEERVIQTSRTLGLPEHLIPLNVVTIGCPTALETAKDKWDASKIIVI